MNIQRIWSEVGFLFVDAWHALGGAGQYYVWLVSGCIGLLAWAVITYYVIRKLLGHRKYLGTWYSQTQYQALMQLLHEKQLAGSQVMAHAELKALRAWKFGGSGEGIFGRQKDSYFG